MSLAEGPGIPLASEPETSERIMKRTKSMLSAAVRADGSHRRPTQACTLILEQITVEGRSCVIKSAARCDALMQGPHQDPYR